MEALKWTLPELDSSTVLNTHLGQGESYAKAPSLTNAYKGAL